VSLAALLVAAMFVIPRMLTSPQHSDVSAQAVPGAVAAKPATQPGTTAAVEKPAPVKPGKPADPAPAPAKSASAHTAEAAAGEVVHQVLPEVSDQASRTIRGRVTVNVAASVDPSGHVTAAKVAWHNSRYFANLSLQAARQWEFQPSGAASDWMLKFEITAKGAEVHPVRVVR